MHLVFVLLVIVTADLREDLVAEQTDARDDIESALPLVGLGRVLASYFRLVHLIEDGLYRVYQIVHGRAEHLLVHLLWTVQNANIYYLLDEVAGLLYVLEVILKVHETLLQHWNVICV